MYDKNVFDKAWNHNCGVKMSHNRARRKRRWREQMAAGHGQPEANVRELDDRYELHIIAPGRTKEDFNITLIDQTLSISAEEKTTDQSIWKRQEFKPQAFTRRFEINEKVDRSSIAASYDQGILVVKLPKLEGFETARFNIEIN